MRGLRRKSPFCVFGSYRSNYALGIAATTKDSFGDDIGHCLQRDGQAVTEEHLMGNHLRFRVIEMAFFSCLAFIIP